MAIFDIYHKLNWCRSCKACLSCPRNRRNLFGYGSCRCQLREISHNLKDVKANRTIDYRYRRLKEGEVICLQLMRENGKCKVPKIGDNLVKANICCTCQQRLRNAFKGYRLYVSGVVIEDTSDFRINRSITYFIYFKLKEIGYRKNQIAVDSLHSNSEGSCGQPPSSTPSGPSRSNTISNLVHPASSGNTQRETGANQNNSFGLRCLTEATPFASPSENDSSNGSSSNVINHGMPRWTSKVVTVFIYDTSETVLLVQRVVARMCLKELLYSHYPKAPPTLLFRDKLSGCLLSPTCGASKLLRSNHDLRLDVIASIPRPLMVSPQWSATATSTIISPPLYSPAAYLNCNKPRPQMNRRSTYSGYQQTTLPLLSIPEQVSYLHPIPTSIGSTQSVSAMHISHLISLPMGNSSLGANLFQSGNYSTLPEDHP